MLHFVSRVQYNNNSFGHHSQWELHRLGHASSVRSDDVHRSRFDIRDAGMPCSLMLFKSNCLIFQRIVRLIVFLREEYKSWNLKKYKFKKCALKSLTLYPFYQWTQRIHLLVHTAESFRSYYLLSWSKNWFALWKPKVHYREDDSILWYGAM